MLSGTGTGTALAGSLGLSFVNHEDFSLSCMVYGLWSLPYNITSIMARTRVKQPPRHRRPDLVALIALMGLTSMIYILTTDTDDLPIDPAARAVEKNDIYRRGPHLRGLVADQSKEMDEFSVWVQENTDIRNELQRQRVRTVFLFASNNFL